MSSQVDLSYWAPVDRRSMFQMAGDPIMNAINEKRGDPNAGLMEHQHAALEAIVARFSQKKTENVALLRMVTGGGKTGVAIATMYAMKYKRVLVMTPPNIDSQFAQEICPLDEFGRNGFVGKINILPHGTTRNRWCPVDFKVEETTTLTKAGIGPLSSCDVVICSTKKFGGNARSELTEIDQSLFDLVVIDEAHKMPSSVIFGVFEHFYFHSHVLMLSATPFRSDGQGLLEKPVKFTDPYGELREGMVPPEFSVPVYNFGRREALAAGVIRDFEQQVFVVEADSPNAQLSEEELNDLVSKSANIGKIRFPGQPAQEEEAIAARKVMLLDVYQTLKMVLHCVDSMPAVVIKERECSRLALVTTGSSDGYLLAMLVVKEHFKNDATTVVSSQSDRVNKANKKAFEACNNTKRMALVQNCLIEGYDQPTISVIGVLHPISSDVKFHQLLGRAVRRLPDMTNACLVSSRAARRDTEKMYQRYRDDRLIRDPRTDDE